MRFDVVTLFPEMVASAAVIGVTGKAVEQGSVELNVWNPRDFTTDRHRTVDDRPYGGGPGMVMKIQPLQDAVHAAKKAASGRVKTVCLSPQGKRIDQQLINQASRLDGLILVAGSYEGIDERFIEIEVDEEWSLGDFVISGGELAALVVIDAITRLLPGVLGDENSARQDSHMEGMLDCPHYTRPEEFSGRKVPEVLLSGNHADIKRWRLQQALVRTGERRMDLLEKLNLSEEQKALLAEYNMVND